MPRTTKSVEKPTTAPKAPRAPKKSATESKAVAPEPVLTVTEVPPEMTEEFLPLGDDGPSFSDRMAALLDSIEREDGLSVVPVASRSIAETSAPVESLPVTDDTALNQAQDTPEEEGDTVEMISGAMDLLTDFGGVPETSAADTTTQTPVEGHPVIGAIYVKTLDHHEGLPLPEYKSDLASGFDLIAANYEPIYLNSMGSSVEVPTGICLEIPAGYEGQVRPRSGLARKHGITVTNTPGTIDADYRGEIIVLLTNLTGGRFKIERGMRIAQMVICPVVRGIITKVDDLGVTERGANGFGSTGVN